MRSGMPSTRARRLCPQAVVISPDYDAFSTVSTSVMEVFRRVTPLGGAGVDGRGVPRRQRCGTPARVAGGDRRVDPGEGRRRAGHHLLGRGGRHGRGGQDREPAGQARRGGRGAAAETTTFLHPLPVEELWGVGEKTAEQLHRLGLRTVADIAHTPMATLQRAIGTAHRAPSCTSWPGARTGGW